MNNTEYKYFSEIARTLSFSKAAKNLFISQPALSHCIAKLEAEFEVKLLNRNKNSVLLTAAGEALLNEYPKVMLANYQLKQKIASSYKETTNLYIAIQNGYLLNERLRIKFKEFEKNNPTITLNFINLDFTSIFNNLESGNVDMTIAFDFNQNKHSEYHKIVLDSIEEYILVGNDHPALKCENEAERNECLSNSNLLIIDNSVIPNITSFLIKSCNKNDIFPKNIKYIKNHSTLCNNIIMDNGFSIIYREALINNNLINYLPLRHNKLCNLCAFYKENNESIILKDLVDFLNK